MRIGVCIGAIEGRCSQICKQGLRRLGLSQRMLWITEGYEGRIANLGELASKCSKELVPGWQESYMERLMKEYIELLSSQGNASDHSWALEKRIKQDKKHPGVLLELRKSSAIWDIATFVGHEIITMDELEEFSDDLKEAVKLILSRYE